MFPKKRILFLPDRLKAIGVVIMEAGNKIERQ